MAYSIWVLLLVPPITYTIWNLQCLWRNYRLAKKMNVPIIIIPASGDNPVWLMVAYPVLAILKFIFGDINLVKYARPGWSSAVKHKMHEELGDVVMHVSPGLNWLFLCNAEAINDMFKRTKDFDRPPDLLGKLF